MSIYKLVYFICTKWGLIYNTNNAIIKGLQADGVNFCYLAFIY